MMCILRWWNVLETQCYCRSIKMLNTFLTRIISEYGFQSPVSVIQYESYGNLDQANLDRVKKAFNFSEKLLDIIPCSGCCQLVDVQRIGRAKYFNCRDCGENDEIKDGRDLAYIITLDEIANFLISALSTKPSEHSKVNEEIFYLGKKEIKDLGGLMLDIYLCRSSSKSNQEELLKYCKKTPSVIIRLSADKFHHTAKNMSDCWFNDLIFYDERLKKFSANDNILSEATQGCFGDIKTRSGRKVLEEGFLLWLKNLFKKNAIQRGDKQKIKLEAVEKFGITFKTFENGWSEEAPSPLKERGRIKAVSK